MPRTPANIRKVFTDRGILERRVKGPRVRGETQIELWTSPYFACRIDPANGSEVGRNMRKELEISHTMICGLDYPDETPLVIAEQDAITIERGGQGSSVYEPYAQFEVVGVVMIPRNLKKELLQVIPLKQLVAY